VTFLLPLTVGGLVVRGAALASTLAAMVLTAAKRATHVPAMGAAGMNQKPNAAMHTVLHAPRQLGMRRHDRLQGSLVMTDNRLGAMVLVPIRPKREKFPRGEDKKARLSVTIRIGLCTSSSYLLGANAARGRARNFYAPGKKPAATIRTTPATPPDCPTSLRSLCRAPSPSHAKPPPCTLLENQTFLRRHYKTRSLERSNHTSSFQVAGQFT
jgi:hypothetical protein